MMHRATHPGTFGRSIDEHLFSSPLFERLIAAALVAMSTMRFVRCVARHQDGAQSITISATRLTHCFERTSSERDASRTDQWRVRRTCIVFATLSPSIVAGATHTEHWPRHTLMHELSTELGNFIGGAINLDQLRAVFRTYIAQHQDQRETISRWLRNTVEEGRLSANRVAVTARSVRSTITCRSPGRRRARAIRLTRSSPAAPRSFRAIAARKTQLASPRAAAAATEHVKNG